MGYLERSPGRAGGGRVNGGSEVYLLSVNVYLDTYISDALFTGKLVKSLLIDANPRLKEVFAKTSGSQPKLVHVTPLYQEVGGKVRCLYSYAVGSEDGGRGGRGVARVTIGRGTYRFYVGFVDGDVYGALGFDELYNTLLNISGRHRFGNHDVVTELQSVGVVDAKLHARRAVEGLVSGGWKLRLVFSSPTLLRDPLRASKYKSLVPTPINIFSTPVYILHYLKGKLTARNVMKTLLILHRLLNEPYSYLRTVSTRWVVYERGRNPIPALVGYVNLYLNSSYYEQYAKRYEVEELLEKVLTVTSVLGTGTSRASGFGHVLVEVAKKLEQEHVRNGDL